MECEYILQTWLYGITGILNPASSKLIMEMVVSGNYSKQMEELPENEVKTHLIELITKVMGVQPPEPSLFRR